MIQEATDSNGNQYVVPVKPGFQGLTLPLCFVCCWIPPYLCYLVGTDESQVFLYLKSPGWEVSKQLSKWPDAKEVETAGWATAGEEAGLFWCGGVTGKVSSMAWSVPLAPVGPITPAPPYALLHLPTPSPLHLPHWGKVWAFLANSPNPSYSGWGRRWLSQLLSSQTL